MAGLNSVHKYESSEEDVSVESPLEDINYSDNFEEDSLRDGSKLVKAPEKLA